jgi:hypothetical protein
VLLLKSLFYEILDYNRNDVVGKELISFVVGVEKKHKLGNALWK